jgi:hypothetical protein
VGSSVFLSQAVSAEEGLRELPAVAGGFVLMSDGSLMDQRPREREIAIMQRPRQDKQSNAPAHKN